MESLCNTAVSSAKNASKKGNFEDIGKTFTDGLSSAIDTQVSKATTAGKNLINKEIKSGKNKDTDQYDKKIKDLNKKIKKAKKEKKSTKSLEKQLKQVKDKKKAVADTYSQLGKSMITAYSNAVKQQGQQIISQAEKEIEELSAAYQEKYNSLILFKILSVPQIKQVKTPLSPIFNVNKTFEFIILSNTSRFPNPPELARITWLASHPFADSSADACRPNPSLHAPGEFFSENLP